MDGFKCPECGAEITDEAIEKAIDYAHDCGFDEGYETAEEELFSRHLETLESVSTNKTQEGIYQ